MFSRLLVVAAVVLAPFGQVATAADSPDHRYLYVVCPGIRNYLEFGGAGILVFDIDSGHKFVKRIATPDSRGEMPDNIKGSVPVPRPAGFTSRPARSSFAWIS